MGKKSQPSNVGKNPNKRSLATVMYVLLAIAILAFGGSYFFFTPHSVPSSNVPATIRPTLVNVFPHDQGAFTQGLIVSGNIMWESTGLYGRSSLRKVELSSGKILQQVRLEQKYFGEGLAVHGDKLYQLTWREKTIFVYSFNDMSRLRTVPTDLVGWGLTSDGQSLILSDGSNKLYFLDPETLGVKHMVEVKQQKSSGVEPVTQINELEYIDGLVYANIWMTDTIVIIDPHTGYVKKVLDVGFVNPKHERPPHPDAVLNGIAYDSQARRLFITGKFWPLIYEIEPIRL
eukprot:TRINITY_DN647_c0_g1_i4.p1 TRINITY_DN647_c0_g1~~TRINITY_DN647_c0_g1_i4.p1  ORF type:complete len:288 (-),score=27.14 TRINITY_DN647_c0_g1_i4:39-902(-)